LSKSENAPESPEKKAGTEKTDLPVNPINPWLNWGRVQVHAGNSDGLDFMARNLNEN
jgi:hypothetical protein